MKNPHPKVKSPGNDRGKDLGHILDHFPRRSYKLKRWLPLIFGGLVIIAAIGLIISLLFNTKTAVQAHGRAVILGTFPLPIAYYILMLIGGILIVILAKIHWWDSITLFETGLIKDKGNRVKIWYYNNTDRFDNHLTQTMFGGSVIGERVKIILEDESKKHLVIKNDWIRMNDLIQALRMRILPDLFQRARQQLRDGQLLHFNKRLQARVSGLEIDGELYPYDQINAEITNRSIKLHQKENPKVLLFKSKIPRVRNLDLLMDLLENPPNQTH